MHLPVELQKLNNFKVEFPYPREKPFSAKTNYIKGNPNPELKFTVKAEINRGHTAFKRAVKNKSIKFVLCQKGGIFSSDKIIGKFKMFVLSLSHYYI